MCSVFVFLGLEPYLGSVMETGCYIKAELDAQVPEVHLQDVKVRPFRPLMEQKTLGFFG